MPFRRFFERGAKDAPPAAETAPATDDTAVVEEEADESIEPETEVEPPDAEWRDRATAVLPTGASTGSKRPAALYGAEDGVGPTHYVRAIGCRVSDANGNVVYSGAGKLGAGDNVFNWNGKDNNGAQLPDGSYTLSVKAQAGGQSVTSSIFSSGQVNEVDMNNGAPQLRVGSMEVPLSSISSVRN